MTGGAGAIGTAITRALHGTGHRTVVLDRDGDVDRRALKRRLTPDDTAAAVAYLASDMAAAMTGQVLCADGGLIMR